MNSFKLPNRVVTDKTLDYSARHLAALLYMVQEQEEECVRSLKQLCEASSYSVATVAKGIRQLRQQGYLSVQKKRRNGKYVNSYHMQLDEEACTDISPEVLAGAAKNMRIVMYLYLLTQAHGDPSVTISFREINRGLQWQGCANVEVALSQLETEGYIEKKRRFLRPEVCDKNEYILKIR